MLAAVKPKKKMPPGLRMKFMMVAMSPMAVTAPSFLIHHAANVKTVKPMRSHRIGKPVRLKITGEKMALSTPHRAAPMAMAAMSRVFR